MGSLNMQPDGKDNQAIAVVGMACRFPGDATDIEKFWDMLQSGKGAWSEIPAERFNAKGWYHPDPNRPGSFHIRGAHFIKGDIAAFDAPFFAISTAEAVSMDPQQRMLLEVVYESLDNAGIPASSLSNTATSVFCGSFVRDYEQPCMRDPDTTPPYSATGNGIAILANRVSHAFDFAGTSQTIDTGCSASMIAVHQACKSLLSGESSVGVAAGVGLIFSPNTLVPMANLNILSPDGRCFTFDKRANGYGRGEGIGVLVLKRLEDAIASNDTIRAVIRATSSNQDGHTQGITLPSEERQIDNMTGIYRNAGLDKSRTAYFECHGTGTQAGDFKEVQAVSKVFRRHETPENPLMIGSVKTNIGHLEGSAGVAGLIKGILVVERGHIPKHLNYSTPNPNIDFAGHNMKIATELAPWPVPGLRRASVNSFGFGGTNSHVVLDDAPHYLNENGFGSAGQHNSFISPDDDLAPQSSTLAEAPKTRLFVYSGHDEAGLGRVIDSQKEYMKQHAKDQAIMTNYSYTLFSRRSRLHCRTFITAATTNELVQKLQEKDMAKPFRGMPHSPSRVALVFCGQGAQWFAMGRELLSYNVFRSSVMDASSYLATSLQSPFHMWEELHRDKDSSHIDKPQIAQPATTIIQVALVDLLVASGIRPTAVVGHSSGEIAAAYAIGAITREDAWKIAYNRGHCVSQIATLAPDMRGGMLAVAVCEADARSTIAESGTQSAEVACINGPTSVTLSGNADDLSRLCEVFRSQNMRASPVKVSTAYHSHHMRVVENIYRDSLKDVSVTKTVPTGAFFSSVHGRKITAGDLNAEYWVKNLVCPVQFYQAVNCMIREADPELFLEVSPHRVWESTLQQICGAVSTATSSGSKSSPDYLSLLHRGKDASDTCLTALGEMWMRGFSVNVGWTFPSESNTKPRHLVDVPSYPWDHSKKYWYESHLSKTNRFRSHGREDIIGTPLENATPQDPRWRGFFRVQENPWLEDHTIQKSIIYPAGGMVAMAIEAAKQLSEPRQDVLGYEVTDFVIAKPMLIPSSPQGLENMLSAHLLESADNSNNGAKSVYEFAILSKPHDAPWITHASGRFAILYKRNDGFVSQEQQKVTKAHRLAYHLLNEKCHTEFVPRQFYESLDVIGMTYGPQFRNLVEIRRGDHAACSVIKIPDTKASMPFQFEFPHIIHPATLDTMLQSVLALGDGGDEAMLPCSVSRVFVSANPPQGAGARFRGYTTAQKTSDRTASAWITMFDDELQTQAVKIENIEFKSVPGQPDGGSGGYLPSHRNLCSEIVWKQDIDSLTALGSVLPDHVSSLLPLAAHKNPALSILHHVDIQSNGEPFDGQAVANAADFVNKHLLGPMTHGCETPQFSELVLSGAKSLEIREQLHTMNGARNTMERVHSSSDLPGDEYNVVVFVPGTETENDSIVKMSDRVASGGWFIFIMPTDAGVDNSRLEAVEDTLKSAGLFVTKAPGSAPGYIMAQKAATAAQDTKRSRLMLLLPERMSPSTALLKDTIRSIFEEQLSTEVCEESLSSLVSMPRQNIAIPCISLVEIDDPVIFSMDATSFDSVHRLLSATKGLVWLTRQAQMEARSPTRSPFIGLSRTLRSEDAKKKIVSLDVDLREGVDELPKGLAQGIAFVFKQTCMTGPVPHMSDDMEFVFSGGRLMIPRLMPLAAMNHLIERRPASDSSIVQVPLVAESKALRLDPTSIGKSNGPLFIDDNGEAFHPLQPDEVRIAVSGTYLLPEDVALASNGPPSGVFGTDIFGRVIETGVNVTELHLGDLVVALERDTVKTHAIVNQVYVRRVKNQADWKHYCPKAFWTAMYAFRTSRRMIPDDAVLVYGTSTAYGQAAIRLAVALGGKVLAACTNPQEKQLLKEKFLIPDSHILSTEDKNDKFVFEVLSLTEGQGADIVFDPTSQHMEQAFRCVSECGRVIRTSWKSNAKSDWNCPGKNVSLETIDIGLLVSRRPREAARLAADVIQTLQLVPSLGSLQDVEEYSMSDVQSAVHNTHPDSLFGNPRVLLTGNDGTESSNLLANLVNMQLPATDKTDLSPSATYLLVGGMGGLGRSIAEHLAKRGAKYIAFFSRSGATSPSAQALLKKLGTSGIDARAFAVDICSKDELAKTLDDVRCAMPAIGGVIQCAAVVDDAAFPSMDYGRWKKSFLPKTTGSYNLHELLPHDMDFFVFLSSSSGVIGNRGQANYAAGNSFQDALARHRSAHGMHSVSLDFGLVLGAGMVAENEALLDAMRASGFFGIRLEDALLILDRAMAVSDSGSANAKLPAQVVTTVGTGGLTIQNQPSDPFWTRSALFRYLNQVDAPPHGLGGGGNGGAAGASDLRSMIQTAGSSEAAADVVCKQLIATVARRKGMVPDDFDRDQSLGDYGIDSLDSIFVLGWVSRETGITVQTVEGVTIAELSRDVAQRTMSSLQEDEDDE